MHCLDLERGGRDRKQKRELRRNKKVESAELGHEIKFRRLRCYGRLIVGFWSHNNALHSLVLAGEKRKKKEQDILSQAPITQSTVCLFSLAVRLVLSSI